MKEISKEQNDYLSAEETDRDDEAFRHSYHEEQQVLFAVREGRAEDAIRISEHLDTDSGSFAHSELVHWRTSAIVSITLVARAAIEVGIPPAVSYRISGYYINKCNNADSRERILHYRNRNIEDFCEQVRSAQLSASASDYTRRCQDYILKHFREKIYVEDIAAPMGISTDHLARIFKKDTGLLIHEYIRNVRIDRASNLLIYTDLNLSVIADYVHFPSQSYFGKVFKEMRGMTPLEFRKRYQISELW